MLDRALRYESVYRGFRWSIPAEFNIAAACCDRWAEAEPERAALLGYLPGAPLLRVSYGELKRLSGPAAVPAAPAPPPARRRSRRSGRTPPAAKHRDRRGAFRGLQARRDRRPPCR